MLNNHVFSTTCATPTDDMRIAAPVIRDAVNLRALMGVLRRVKSVRAVASADAKEFSRRIDAEIPRYRMLAACFESSADPGDRRQLQGSLHHLHNLRFALRNASASVEHADRLVAGIHSTIDNLHAPATGHAA